MSESDNTQTKMFQDILEYIETCSTIKPTEKFTEDLWREEINDLFEVIETNNTINSIKDEVIEILVSFYSSAKTKGEYRHTNKRQKRETQLQELVNAPQIEQRTAEWYKHMLEFLTASQFASLIAGGRTRAKLVMSKAFPSTTEPPRRLAVLSHEMNPFDWGIRFEPVAKLIYETITGTTVREIGRLVHMDPKLKLAASPDGIVETCKNNMRIGRLVELKDPITRKIESGVVPNDYWIQMQIQMEVANIDSCDYFEIEIRSKNKSEIYVEGPCLFFGTIQVIGAPTEFYEDPQPTRYAYSAINSDIVEPCLQSNETILETVTWEVMCYNLVTVHRSFEWFESITPEIKKFWEDVDAAKAGGFELPPSKRKTKYNICMIQDDIEPATAATAALSINTEDEIMVEG